MAFILFVVLSLALQGALGELLCEEIPVRLCSLSVSSSGKRCLLESVAAPPDRIIRCRTSEVVVDGGVREHIETDECVDACGVDRYAMGISSDSLMEPQFTASLCSEYCLNNCPNVVDLYSNLITAEGGDLRILCQARTNIAPRRREMTQLSGSTNVAGAPYGSVLSFYRHLFSELAPSTSPAPEPTAGPSAIGSSLFGCC